MKLSELLAKPENWTQEHQACDAQGNSVSELAPTAVSWCLLGAIKKLYPDSPSIRDGIRTKIFMAINSPRLFGRIGITDWNDNPKRKHEEVLRLCKELNI